MSRADAGMPRLTRRDLDVLAYLEEMRAMWEPDVAALLGAWSGRAPVSPTSVRTALRRWAKLGLVQVSKLFAHEPRLVWLTSAGAAMAGARGADWREPGPGVVRHTAEIARVRAWLEGRGIAGQPVTEWISERRWRQQHTGAIRQGAHVPDGVAVTPEGSYAIEVELSDKGPSRTLDMAVSLTQSFDRVIYLVVEGSQTARTVNGALQEVAQRRGLRGGNGALQSLELPRASWEKDVEFVDRQRGATVDTPRSGGGL